MTQNYTLTSSLLDQPAGTEAAQHRFPSISFLILCNRVLAILVALVALFFRKQDDTTGSKSSAAAPRRRVPYELTGVASVANTMSSYFQYAALQYVSFPVQVLAKACKMIPNMVVGVLLGRQFKRYEYVMAVVVPLGVAIFSFDQYYLTTADSSGGGSSSSSSSSSSSGGQGADTDGDLFSSEAALGYAMIAVYLLFDALTSNWQGHLFRTCL